MRDVEIEISDSPVLYINTHKSEIVIQDEQIERIKRIDGVKIVAEYGTYGMELWVLLDSEEYIDSIILEIKNCLNC